MRTNEKIKNYCASCFKLTNHIILYAKEQYCDDFEESTYYEVVQCMGCDAYSYRTETVSIRPLSPDDSGNTVLSYEIFPKVLKHHKTKLHYEYIPDKIATVYKEATKAFAADCYLLAAVGFRAVIEAICKDKNIPGRNLSLQIANLAKQKLITENEAERLQPIRFLGNDGVHEMAVPTTKALDVVLNVVQHLLNNIYVIDNLIKNDLDTVINNILDLKILIGRQAYYHKKGQEYSLPEILGKHHRRLLNKTIDLEKELKSAITNDIYKKLALGSIDNNDPNKPIQKYIILDTNLDDDDPFII